MTNIVITKAEAICSIGNGLQEISSNLGAADISVSEFKETEFHQFDQPVPCFRVQSLDPVAILGKKGMRTKDWSTKLLLSTIELGFKDLFESLAEENKPGICIGTGFGSVQSIGDFLSESIVSGVNNVNPQAFANTVINAPTSYANVRHEVRALSTTVSTGFNASMDAFIYGADYIRRGYADWMIVGGLEEISYYGLLGMQRSGMLSPTGNGRPFGNEADGIIPGEGCAAFLLETREHAQARGAEIIAEVAGYSSLFDSSSMGAAQGSGARRVIEQASCDSGLSPTEIGFISASANGTAALDRMEAAVLNDMCRDVPVTSYKQRMGECYGAGAGLNLACAVTDLQNGRISGVSEEYPTVQELSLVSGSVSHSAESVLVNSFSCDGFCGSIILKR